MDIFSTIDVLDRHLRAFRNYEGETLLADYASDAPFFCANGVAKRADRDQPFFEALVFRNAKSSRRRRVPSWCSCGALTRARRATRRTAVDAGHPEGVAASMTEHRQRETGLRRVLLLTRRTLR